MDKKRIFLLERDRVEAGAVAALIEQCGCEVAKVAHSLEDAMALDVSRVDFGLIERDLGDGTDATPIAEMLSAAGIPYAFIIQPGDRADPTLFPGAGFLRKPLSAQGLEAALAEERGDLPPAADSDEAVRRAEIEMIKSKLQQTAIEAEAEQD